MGKAFEKQTKTIKDQGEKKKAIRDNKEQLVNINDDNYKNKSLLSKEREIFKQSLKSLNLLQQET